MVLNSWSVPRCTNLRGVGIAETVLLMAVSTGKPLKISHGVMLELQKCLTLAYFLLKIVATLN